MSAILLDTETTGLSEPIRPVEVAWIRLTGPRPLRQVESFGKRYDPERAIEYGAMATHHITARKVAGLALWSTFRLPEETEYLIGHNVDFDWKVLGEPAVKRVCTLALARSLWPDCDSHTLGALLYLVAPAAVSTRLHGAFEDCIAAQHVLGAILAHPSLAAVDTWEALWQASEAARVPAVMPYGKHKGLELAKVPADYKRWLLGQPDVDPYLRKALTPAG